MADTIRLECPECGREMDVARHRTDYPEAVRLQMRCPDCDRGDHAELVYVDAAGKHITRDPDEFLRAADQQTSPQPDAVLAFCGPFPEQSEDERTLRRLLALAYAGSGELYGDDGELQLGGFPHPIDFRRMSVAEIEKRIHARGMAKLVEQMRAARALRQATPQPEAAGK